MQGVRWSSIKLQTDVVEVEVRSVCFGGGRRMWECPTLPLALKPCTCGSLKALVLWFPFAKHGIHYSPQQYNKYPQQYLWYTMRSQILKKKTHNNTTENSLLVDRPWERATGLSSALAPLSTLFFFLLNFRTATQILYLKHCLMWRSKGNRM